MNSNVNARKLLLAKIRNGNYAHAGEEEAIELTMNLILKNPVQTLLDLGCGLGGTADYLQKNQWGKVVGIDIDTAILQQAKRFYSDIQFELCDASQVDTFFSSDRFNVFYSFNAFFCFSEQEQCLKAIANLATKNAELLIFDYSSPNYCEKKNPFIDRNLESNCTDSFQPINLDLIEKTLCDCHWQLKKTIDVTEKYHYWYQSLLEKMQKNKQNLIEQFGPVTFDDLYVGYQKLLAFIDEGEIGGCIIHASLQ